jgi:hypothetical protein
MSARSSPNSTATSMAYFLIDRSRFAPDEAYQFDWSHEIVILDGVTTEVKVSKAACQLIAGAQPAGSTTSTSTPEPGRLEINRPHTKPRCKAITADRV